MRALTKQPVQEVIMADAILSRRELGYYVYVHKRATDNSIFYVGKGKGERAWDKINRSDYWKRIVAKYGHTVEIVESGMQEWWSLEMERELIALYGDALCNLTDGGETSAGYRFTPEAKAKISAGNKGKRRTPEQKQKLRAIFGNPEYKAKLKKSLDNPEVRARKSASIKAAMANKPLTQAQLKHLRKLNSPEVRSKVKAILSCPEKRKLTGQAISKAMKGRPANEVALAAARAASIKPFRCVDTDTVFDSLADAVQWLVTMGHPKAAKSALIAAAKGRRGYTQAYGYRWAYA